MPYVDDTVDTLTEDLWEESTYTRESASLPSTPAEGKIAGFFHSMVASMALLRRSTRHHQPHANLSATEFVAQNYPHLYIRVMCG